MRTPDARRLRAAGQLNEAVARAQEVIAIEGELFNDVSEARAATLEFLANKSQRNYAAALPLYARAVAISRKLRDWTAGIQSERQQLAIGGSLRWYLDSYLSCVVESQQDADKVCVQALAWKGAVLARQRALRLARSGGSPELAHTLAELQDTSDRLATLAFAAPAPDRREMWQRDIARLVAQKEGLERRLSELSSEFRRQRAEQELSAAALIEALPANTALVDFLEYNLDRLPPEGRGEVQFERRLAAFVVRADRSIRLVDLGPAAAISQAVEAWRRDMGEGPSAGELRRLVRVPLEEFLVGATTVVVSPDGALTRFPLSALPGSKPGTYLTEDVAIAVVPVPSLLPEILAEHQGTDAPRSPSLLLVGDVDFGALPGNCDAVGRCAVDVTFFTFSLLQLYRRRCITNV